MKKQGLAIALAAVGLLFGAAQQTQAEQLISDHVQRTHHF
ncbi:hypothetical protein BH20ACI3_BH20ACI3_40680 [soil metagenome]